VTAPPEYADPLRRGRLASYAEAATLVERQPLQRRLELIAPLVEAGLRGPSALHRRMLDERLDRFGELLERTKGEQA